MNIEIQNVVFACPGDSMETYEAGARPIASFYANFLGMRIVREDWFVIENEDDPDSLNLAFGDGPINYRPPRWPDPEYPQQMHLDISVHDLPDAELRAARELAEQIGAIKLTDKGGQLPHNQQIYADSAGHPFCL